MNGKEMARSADFCFKHTTFAQLLSFDLTEKKNNFCDVEVSYKDKGPTFVESAKQ